MLTFIFYAGKVVYQLRISRIHPAVTVTLPLPLWHLRSMISAWRGGLWKTFGIPDPLCG